MFRENALVHEYPEKKAKVLVRAHSNTSSDGKGGGAHGMGGAGGGNAFDPMAAAGKDDKITILKQDAGRARRLEISFSRLILPPAIYASLAGQAGPLGVTI